MSISLLDLIRVYEYFFQFAVWEKSVIPPPISVCPRIRCVPIFVRVRTYWKPTRDGRCKDPSFSNIGEPCNDWSMPCLAPTVCNNFDMSTGTGTCECPNGMRKLTEDEIWLNPMEVKQCVDFDYSIRK